MDLIWYASHDVGDVDNTWYGQVNGQPQNSHVLPSYYSVGIVLLARKDCNKHYSVLH